MRESSVAFSLAVVAAMAFALVATLLLAPEFAEAGDTPQQKPQASEPDCGCPQVRQKSMRPKFAELKPQSDRRGLDAGDEMATLSSVQHALTKVADGSTYVWHRTNGRISGIVQPTSSFKNSDGEICRHIIVMLTTGNKTRKTEGVGSLEG